MTVQISFGVVLTPIDGSRWVDTVRRTEQQGWTSVLVPDTLWTPSPFPTLAAAAAVTTGLRLRTWVLAAPFRSPAAVVRETSALQVLSEGRFELGIGSGRPDAQSEAARLGVPWGTARERIAQVEDVVVAVREQVRPVPRIVVAAGGPRMVASAARIADRVALALPPQAGPPELRDAIQRLQEAAGRPIGVSQQLVGLAGRLPSWLSRTGLDPRALADTGAVAMLTGDAEEMAATLLRRHEEFGVDEYIAPGELADDFAPVIRRLDRCGSTVTRE